MQTQDTEEELAEQQRRENGRVRQSDPLRGKIREPLPENALENVNLWFILGKVAKGGELPRNFKEGACAHYMRAQGRVLAMMELWMLARGEDIRGDDKADDPSDALVSVSKLFGGYIDNHIVGPDRFYQMCLLKDYSKANKTGRPELIGATRHKNPLLCSINAVTTMLILRYAQAGLLGGLPDFFDAWNDWPTDNSLVTQFDGEGMISYRGTVANPGMYELFDQMKQGAAMQGLLHDIATKLRSYGAMQAAMRQSSHPEIGRAGRYHATGIAYHSIAYVRSA